ncbi:MULTISPECIES: O-antigen ligase family protein [unclassified Mesorhizobium]|uniref:O-antigen ligase family protein n=1 Tax=unclassified Mesorhizobium TaxID=325217 RepID=UPI000FD9D0E4|nr:MULTISPECIES: O-antigen ligase family protein [unclassified Mesorhizobium]TGQ42019.1 O-antigen ligase domain-containing protein [Mesorhizobium sp. M00.F.Ca.ET.216.01.1.1]TIS55051.1 MAG: O-antigen ligase family protein [Mesorhizobium sp.]TIS92956.1 MAG: O-antigen ligase family protein [Mesorhizobium sp.]TJW14859.1 MAG: O-antigen ligase family protein [Mesorhizobium sp.]TJW48917.1 MAG: O-antigen ligase family protein [Mesorhizobium sp.]
MSQAEQLSGSTLKYGIPSSRTALRRLEFWLACAAVFFAPMNVLRLPDFYFTAGDAFACLCIGAMVINGTIKPKALGPGTAYWLFGLVTMVGALLASSLLAGVVDRGMILSMQYLFAYFLLPLILLGRPWRETDVLMKVFVASMVVMILHGIYVVDFVRETNTTFVSGSGRLQGFVERENECGSLFALTVPMVLSMAATRTIHPVVALIVMLLLGYGIMLTGSNTALYGMLFGLGVFTLASLTAKRILLVAIGCLLLWAAISMPGVVELLPAVFQKRVLVGLETGNLDEAGTFADRMLLIKEAIRLGGDSSLLGSGADQYREISAWHAPVHNLYLLIWNEGGFLALVGFLTMLSGAAITVAIAWRSGGGHSEAICGFSTVALFTLLVNAVPHVYGRFWAVPVLLSLAPAISLINEGPRRRRPPHPSRNGY